VKGGNSSGIKAAEENEDGDGNAWELTRDINRLRKRTGTSVHRRGQLKI
jgi:hypothetical protein